MLALEPAWRVALFTLAGFSWYLGIGLTLTFALLLFPTGRLPSRRWRPVAWLAGLGIGVLGIGGQSEVIHAGEPTLFSALGVAGLDHAALVHLWIAGIMVVATTALASAASLVVRFRRARGQERQQLKWFAAAALVAGMVAFTAESLTGDAGTPLAMALGDVVWPLSMATVPIAAGIAVLRYRLYDIDLIIRRTAVYGALTAALAAVYLGGVLLLRGPSARSPARVRPGHRRGHAGGGGAVPPLRRPHPGVHRPPLLPPQVRRGRDAGRLRRGAARRASTWTGSPPSCSAWWARRCSPRTSRCGCGGAAS